MSKVNENNETGICGNPLVNLIATLVYNKVKSGCILLPPKTEKPTEKLVESDLVRK